MLSSAFLAHVVRVHDEGGLGQQKANPNVDLGSVTDPHLGGRVVQTRGSGRAQARRGDAAKYKRTHKNGRESLLAVLELIHRAEFKITGVVTLEEL